MLLMVTGASGSGKSTLCQKVIEALNWKAGGFLTLPIYAEETRIGFDLFLLEKGNMVKPGYSIARWNNLEDHTIFTNTFTVVGTSAIEHGLHDGNDCLIMDEIGRFEKDNEIFLNMVWEALIQKKVPVLVVLKKEKLPFNKKVWGMEKGIHVDMDLMDSEEAFKLSVRYFMEKMETL